MGTIRVGGGSKAGNGRWKRWRHPTHGSTLPTTPMVHGQRLGKGLVRPGRGGAGGALSLSGTQRHVGDKMGMSSSRTLRRFSGVFHLCLVHRVPKAAPSAFTNRWHAKGCEGSRRGGQGRRGEGGGGVEEISRGELTRRLQGGTQENASSRRAMGGGGEGVAEPKCTLTMAHTTILWW